MGRGEDCGMEGGRGGVGGWGGEGGVAGVRGPEVWAGAVVCWLEGVERDEALEAAGGGIGALRVEPLGVGGSCLHERIGRPIGMRIVPLVDTKRSPDSLIEGDSSLCQEGGELRRGVR